VVQILHGLLKRNGDKKTDNDGWDVEKKVAPGMDGFVRRMNF
jgi:hypothetical protein